MDPFLKATIGEYRITGVLGEGGMGKVYRATHTRLGRDAAVKVLTAAAGDPVFLQRFLNEAQIQSRLRDPGIADLYDYTEVNGSPVMIMEFVDGETLQEITRRQGSWAIEQAVPVLRECARTLEYVHSQGIIHRDLKSANVKVTSKGATKLLDFGIAIPNDGRTMARLTTAGFVIGTFQSLAPEQTLGEQASPASDIWSFGVLAYEMVTGSLPFEAANAGELFRKIARATYTSPCVLKPGVPKSMEAVIGRCLRRDPHDRYRSVGELRRELDAIEVGTAPRRPNLRTSVPAIPWKPVLIGCLGLAVVVGGVVGYEHLGSGPDPAPQPVAPLKQEGTVESGTFSVLQATGGDPSNPKNVTVDTFDGSAEIWQNGQKVGNTPYTVQEPSGGSVQFILKRPGFRDLPVQFDVGERRNYEYGLERSATP